MKRFLLDVNVLIALIDSVHLQHGLAHDWFGSLGTSAWATCPLVENGVLRILGNRRYPGSPGTPAAVVPSLEDLRASPTHEFWADDFSLLGCEWVNPSRLLDSSQITDTYLLALARSKDSQLATFDRRLVTEAVRGGKGALALIA